MIVLNNTLLAIANVIGGLLTFYFWIVIAAAVVSWFGLPSYHPAVRFLAALTEPVFYRVRKWLPFTYYRSIDFSPLVVILAIELVKTIVIQSIVQYAVALQ